MAYNFPAGPAVGDTYTAPDGKLTYGWNGFAWDMKAKAAATQRPELIELSPFLVEAGTSDVELHVIGDLLTPTTQIIIIPDGGAEQVLPTTFISLTEVSATFPNSTVVGHNLHDVYLETDGLRSQRMRQVCVTTAPVLNYIDPVSTAAGGPQFTLLFYFDRAIPEGTYPCNSGYVGVVATMDGASAGGLDYITHVQYMLTPDAIAGTPHEFTASVRGETFGGAAAGSIPSHDPPLILTYT